MTGVERVKEIFGQARALRGTERTRFVDSACAGEFDLRREVEDLLIAMDSAGAGGFLGAPTGALPEDSGPDDHPAGHGPAPEGVRPGLLLGRYRLVRALGEGGFGEVWEAEQYEPVRRRVAVKIVKAGVSSAEVLARFQAERQALALMDHPNVAKIYDAGAAESGRPFVVMEYVAGIPITEHCDRARLPIADRLELFVPVCQAVQHAHTKGVIHRDLKPANILVAMLDGRPVPKVIDFGIAKATGGGALALTDRTLLTRAGGLMGTPTYMSPEQAGSGGLDVDTRTDTYSLGVILYQLVSGVLPFDARAVDGRDLAALLRTICEDEPPTPSSRVTVLSAGTRRAGAGASSPAPGDEGREESAAAIASARRTDPPSLARRLRGELDWIVMRCLEKDRSRRYDTADALAMDVRRHLDGEPVAAAPPSRVYRLRKFTRRHRVAVVMGSLLAALLVVGGVATATLWQRARREADRVRDQRDKAETIAVFLEQTLGNVQSCLGLGRDPRLVQELMDRAAARIIDGKLENAPEAELRLRLTVGTVYSDLGHYAMAHQMLDPMEGIAAALYGAESRPVAEARRHVAEALRREGRLAEAEVLARSAVGLYRAHPEWGPGWGRAEGEWFLAHVLRDAGRGDEAAALLRQGMAWADQRCPDADEHVCFMEELALILLKQPDAAGAVEAESLMRQALTLCEMSEPQGRVRPWQSGYAASVLGEALVAQGRFADAEPRLLSGYRRLWAPDVDIPRRALVGVDFKRDCVTRLVALYRAWHAAEPDAGHDGEAERWQRELQGAEGAGP